jgi:small subunit ribosomal protein S8
MLTTDPIADFLTRIRNAQKARKVRVDIPYSKMKADLARILMDCSYIYDYVQVDEGPQGFLRLYLKYSPKGEAVIQGLKRVSRPGLRKYVTQHDMPRVLNGLGVAILTTSKGVMTSNQARREGLGGEVLAEIW